MLAIFNNELKRIIVTIYTQTANVVTSIKQSPVSKGHLFLVIENFI